MSEHDPKNVV